MNKVFVILTMLFAAVFANAQQVANFSLVNVITGSEVSLDSYPSCSGIVIIFTSNNCAYDEYYRSRIDAVSREFQDKVPVLLVNSGIDPIESADNMVRKAQQLGLKVPYLADKDQRVMQRLGAAKTPQAFLLKNNGGKFSVVYSGAIDDNAQVKADVRHSYLKDAIEILLTNQEIETAEVRPVGCSLRKK